MIKDSLTETLKNAEGTGGKEKEEKALPNSFLGKKTKSISA